MLWNTPTSPLSSVTPSEPPVIQHRLTLQDRLNVIKFCEEHPRLANEEAASVLKRRGYVTLSPSSVWRLNKSKDELGALAQNPNELRFKRVHQAEYPDVDQALQKWILQKQGGLVRLTGNNIRIKAKRFATPAFPDEEPETDFQSHSDCKDIPQIEQTTTPAALAVPTPPRVPTPSQLPSRSSPFRPPSPPRISKISALPIRLLGKLRTANAFLSHTSVLVLEPDYIEGQGFAIAVVHIPRDPARNLYERLVYVKLGDRQLQIPDPDFHALEPHEVTVDDKTLAAAFILVGEFMLNPEKFQKTIGELQMEID
ncbi:hypothetical protein FRC07_014638 [Ceratobasidium sp. 392]|nr:hypothetical protein FRC07_014638 [Ceratobasidium sp. 392]